jgi:hypothetical protein
VVAFWLTTSAVRPEKFTDARKVSAMTPAIVERFNGGGLYRLNTVIP